MRMSNNDDRPSDNGAEAKRRTEKRLSTDDATRGQQRLNKENEIAEIKVVTPEQLKSLSNERDAALEHTKELETQLEASLAKVVEFAAAIDSLEASAPETSLQMNSLSGEKESSRVDVTELQSKLKDRCEMFDALVTEQVELQSRNQSLEMQLADNTQALSRASLLENDNNTPVSHGGMADGESDNDDDDTLSEDDEYVDPPSDEHESMLNVSVKSDDSLTDDGDEIIVGGLDTAITDFDVQTHHVPDFTKIVLDRIKSVEGPMQSKDNLLLYMVILEEMFKCSKIRNEDTCLEKQLDVTLACRIFGLVEIHEFLKRMVQVLSASSPPPTTRSSQWSRKIQFGLRYIQSILTSKMEGAPPEAMKSFCDKNKEHDIKYKKMVATTKRYGSASESESSDAMFQKNGELSNLKSMFALHNSQSLSATNFNTMKVLYPEKKDYGFIKDLEPNALLEILTGFQNERADMTTLISDTDVFHGLKELAEPGFSMLCEIVDSVIKALPDLFDPEVKFEGLTFSKFPDFTKFSRIKGLVNTRLDLLLKKYPFPMVPRRDGDPKKTMYSPKHEGEMLLLLELSNRNSLLSSFKEWIITLELSFMNKGFRGNFAEAYTYGYCYNSAGKDVHLYIVMERGSSSVREVVETRYKAGEKFSQKEVENFELQIISLLSIIHSTSRQSHGDIKLDNFIVVAEQDESFGVGWNNKGTREKRVKKRKERIMPIDQESGEAGLYPRFQTCDSLTTHVYAPPESIIGTVKTLSSIHNGADSYAFGLMILEYRFQERIVELLDIVECPGAIQEYLFTLWKKPEYGHLAHLSEEDKTNLCHTFYRGLVLGGVNADANTKEVDPPYLKEMDDYYETDFIGVIHANCLKTYAIDVEEYSIMDGTKMHDRIQETTKGEKRTGKVWLHRLIHPVPNKRSTLEEYGRGAYS